MLKQIQQYNLDKGEIQAITLALELDLKLIIDEKKGRKIALQHGVKVTGILGILIENYRENHISLNDTHYYLNIYKQNGLRVSDSLEELFFRNHSAPTKDR